MRRTPNEEAARWRKQARGDLRWAVHLAEEGGHDLACFLAQQVAGKALKAFLYAQGEESVLGDSVAVLCEKASAYASSLKEEGSAWAILDGFYLPTRYPNGLPDGIPAHV